jgi:uncharacterized membrane protein SirB2
MNIQLYHILHVFSLVVLTAQTYMAFANPAPENRKRTLMIAGIATLLMLVSGAGMMAKMGYSWGAGWVIVKVLCWLGFSALAGLAYRKPHLRGRFSFIGLVVLLVALVMVYLKPF